MNLARYIGKRFNAVSSQPTSVAIMRRVSVFGIAMAVAALVIASSIGLGFEKEYRRALTAFNSHITVIAGEEIERPAELMEGLDKIRDTGIVAKTPFLYREALSVGRGSVRGVIVKGIDPASFRSVHDVAVTMNDGTDFMKLSLKANAAVLGGSLANILGAALRGSKVRLMVPSDAKGAKRSGKFVDINVTGRFESGLHDFDSQFILLPMNFARGLFGAQAQTISGIELKLADPFTASRVAEAIMKELPLYQAVPWDELNRDIMSAIRLERLVSVVIMGVMVMVAVLNVMASQVLLTMQRLKDTSILKAIGTRGSVIRRVLVACGMRMVGSGVALGLIAGLIISWAVGRLKIIPLEAEIYLISSLPADISPAILLFVAAFCLLAGYLAARFAAGRLSKLGIIEGL